MTPEDRDAALDVIALIEAVRDDRVSEADQLIGFWRQDPQAVIYVLVRAFLTQALLSAPDADLDEALSRWRDHVLGQGG